MRSTGRVVSILLLVVGHSIGATRLSGAEQMVQKTDPISVFSQLKTTLSRLYPIEHWTVSTTADATDPFAPRFCWKFFRPDPETLARLGEGIRSYEGGVNWVLGPPASNAPICLVASTRDRNQFVGYPPINRPEASNVGMERESIPTQEFIDQALADVSNLCSHLERYLKIEGLPAKSFDSLLAAPHDPPSPESAPIDFVERGMHVAWIVQPGTNTKSGDKRMLHFSVAGDEWRRIHDDILVDTSPVSAAATRTEGDSFPLLSRIEESESAHFRRAEVESLRQECLRARARTSDSLAMRGLDKLILICDWANHMGGEILLRAP
jgi:hypothetical protein